MVEITEKIRECVCATKSDADKVAENHRQNYADWVTVTYEAGKYVVQAGYSEQ